MIFKKANKKKNREKQVEPVMEAPKEKPTPAFLREDYPYKAVGEPVIDMDSLDPTTLYEIKCNQCEMSIRTQGINIKSTYERLTESGCIGCGNKALVVKRVNMDGSKA